MKKQLSEKISTYKWSGKDSHGRKVQGEVSAVSPAAAQAELRRRKMMVTRIKKKPKPIFAARKKKIKKGEIVAFSRHIATMLSAGLPLVQALESIGRGHENASVQELILRVKNDVKGGCSFAEALRAHPKQFGNLFCSLVKSGEDSGTLDNMLKRVATHMEKTESLKKKIKKAMFYPASIMAVAFLVSGVLLLFVVPQFEQIFSSFGASLPAFTLLILELSKTLRSNWIYFAVGITALITVFKHFRAKSKKFHYLVDKYILKMYIIGPILHKAAVAKFTRTLSTTLNAGIPIVDAIKSAAYVTSNDVYIETLLRIRDEVKTGQPLNISMTNSNLFTNMVTQMVAVGEESGSTEEMLDKVANFYEEDVDNAVDSLSTLMEPLIMVVLGVIIGSFVLAMYLPIFKLGSIF